MKAILAWELRRRRASTVWWIVGISALVALTVLSYSAVKSSSAQLDQALHGLSSSAGAFLGTSDLFSPVGYLNSNLYFVTLPITYIILALNLSNSLLGKEESDHTLELLLSRPVSRTRLLAGKALAGLTIMLIVGGITTAITLICAQAINLDISLGGLVLANAASVLFAASFGAISYMLLAASLFSRRYAGLAAIVLSIGGYLISSLSHMVSWLEIPAKLTPYYYYDTASLLQNSIPHGLVVYLAGTFLITTVIALYGFRRRDIS